MQSGYITSCGNNTVLKASSSCSLEVESRKVESRKVESRKVEGRKSQGQSAIANIAISKFTKVEILETMGENCMLYFRSYLPSYIHGDRQ